MRYLLLLAVVMVAGCVKRDEPNAPTYAVTVDGVEVRQLPTNIGSTWHQVYFVTSKDGTRCAVYAKEGGITCDWQRPAVERAP